MTLEEYNTQMKALEREMAQKRDALALEYVSKNILYKVGDILECTYAIILVDKLKRRIGFKGIPEAVYVGYALTKKLEPKKNKSWDEIPQCAVIKKLN
jgi:hypothetical protein